MPGDAGSGAQRQGLAAQGQWRRRWWWRQQQCSEAGVLGGLSLAGTSSICTIPILLGRVSSFYVCTERYRVPHAAAYHTPLVPISVLDISTVGMMSVPKRSALQASRRELFEDVSFGIDISGNRAWKTAAGVCDIHRRIRVFTRFKVSALTRIACYESDPKTIGQCKQGWAIVLLLRIERTRLSISEDRRR